MTMDIHCRESLLFYHGNLRTCWWHHYGLVLDESLMDSKSTQTQSVKVLFAHLTGSWNVSSKKPLNSNVSTLAPAGPRHNDKRSFCCVIRKQRFSVVSVVKVCIRYQRTDLWIQSRWRWQMSPLCSLLYCSVATYQNFRKLLKRKFTTLWHFFCWTIEPFLTPILCQQEDRS